MRRSSSKIWLLCGVLLSAHVVAHSQGSMPEAVKTDLQGRKLPQVQSPSPVGWTSLTINTLYPVFPGCTITPGDHYVGLQLTYDLGDNNTTGTWSAHVDIQMVNGVTNMWTAAKPLDISMGTAQTWTQTVFHDLPLNCNTSYFFKVTTKTNTGAIPTGNISVKVVLLKKRTDFTGTDAMAVTATKGSPPDLTNEYTVQFSGSTNATEFDIEWVFVNEYESFYNGTVAEAFLRKEGAGVTVPGSSINFTHRAFYPAGKLCYRVRAVGYNDANPLHRIQGPWGYGNSVTTDNPSVDRTWQARTAFAEDAKYKKTVTYYDPTMRERQVQTNLSTDGTTVVAETLYDFEGRPSLNVLPVPWKASVPAELSSNKLAYKADFNKFGASSSYKVQGYTTPGQKKFHYDNGYLSATTGGEQNTVMDNTTGASKYYSNTTNTISTPLSSYVPKADGWVYSQTMYENDSRVLPIRESIPGADYQTDGSRTVRTFYGQASTTELNRLFGGNVGNAAHYKKIVAVDHNNQASVRYVDQEGRTIASALIGEKAPNLDPLKSFTDLPPATPLTVKVADKNKKEPTATTLVHKILNTYSTEYQFSYSMKAITSQVEEFGCVSCVYDLTITLTEPGGKVVDLSGKPGNLPPQGTTGDLRYWRAGITANCASEVTDNVSFSHTLDQFGDYTLTKKLTPRVVGYETARTIVTGSTSFLDKATLLATTYVVNSSQCTTCDKPVDCPEAYAAIEQAVQETAKSDCESILSEIKRKLRKQNNGVEPQPGDITGHADYCMYTMCTKNIDSDAFDKHMARITNWEGAVSSGYNNAQAIDPFFTQAGLSGDNGTSQGRMTTELGSVKVHGGTQALLTGSILEVTDPNNANYYVNDAGQPDRGGKHVLYYDLMKDKTAPGYTAKLSEARWTMYRNFYLEAKRITKRFAVADFTPCQALLDKLDEPVMSTTITGTSPGTATTGIKTYLDEKGLVPNVTNTQLTTIITQIKSACGNITLTSLETTSLENYLRTYFDNNKLNVWRLIFQEDIGTAALKDIDQLLASKGCNISNIAKPNPYECIGKKRSISGPNLVTNPTLSKTAGCGGIWNLLNFGNIASTCFAGWTAQSGTPRATLQGELLLKGVRCQPQFDAVRGTMAALTAGKLYQLSFKYKAIQGRYNGTQYGGAPAIGIQFSRDPHYKNSVCEGCKLQTYELPNTGGNNPGTGEPEIPETPGEQPGNPGSGTPGRPGPPRALLMAQQFYADVDPNPACTLGGANVPDALTLSGATTTTTTPFYGRPISQEYTEVVIYFTAKEASTYFFLTALTNGTSMQGALLKDFWISEATEICVNYKLKDDMYAFPINWGDMQIQCVQRATEENALLVEAAKEILIEGEISRFFAHYRCIDAITSESLQYQYVPKEYHYTLYYYDQAGNLVQTVPPNGVAPLADGNTTDNPIHTFLTKYLYNSLNMLTSQTSPDAGTSYFIYNRKAQLRLSRNSQQAIDGKYTYTKYDDLGRIKETGLLNSNVQVNAIPAFIEVPANPTTALSDITWTTYDVVDNSIQAQFTQDNVRNRVSYVEITDQQNPQGHSSNIKTYYSYDIHGNVKALRQDIPGLTPKKINYLYDLISGKVTHVFFQQGSTDQFAHRYLYDADNRLVNVATSTDRFTWNTDAKYFYYAHGPLERIELGHHRVQGLDYYYTLQGWVKGVNMPYYWGDFGGDGVGGSVVGKDVFSYAIGYNTADYTPRLASAVNIPGNNLDQVWARYNSQMGNTGLYNGNISWIITDLAKQGDLLGDRKKGLQAVLYKYDQLNRITQARTLPTYNGTAFATRSASAGVAYDENFKYDPNGNMLELKRWNATGGVKDDLTFQYIQFTNKLTTAPGTTDLNVNGGTLPTTNLVYRNITLAGTVSTAPSPSTILKAVQGIKFNYTFTSAPNANFVGEMVPGGDGWAYDANGNITYDGSSSINITWTPGGKVRQVAKTDGSISTTYRYDGLGNRVEKKVVKAGVTTTTHYVQDASGTVMSVYSNTVMIEQPIYGSVRIGQYIGGLTEGTEGYGRRHYELTNHLGNIMTVVSDRVGRSVGPIAATATVLSTADYYAFGSAMSGRTWKDPSINYRYGFNGKEKDQEEWGNNIAYDYGFRIYNPEIGRFMSVDPLTGSYPYWSPYAFAGNTPIQAVDLDGLEIYYAQSGQQLGTYGTSTEIRVVNEDKLAEATTAFAAYNEAIKTDPAATNTFLGTTLATEGSVAFTDYFTAVTDVLNDATLSPYTKVNGITTCNCACAAKKQMTDANVTPSVTSVINTLVDNALQPTNLQLGTANPIGGAIYIQTQLNAGTPVMVGLQEAAAGSTTPQNPGNTNRTTGHFVVIVGTNVSETNEISFRYYDNATSANGKKLGNQLSLNTTTGIAEDLTPANVNKSFYKISEVRKNPE